jgi:hypothetical protein
VPFCAQIPLYIGTELAGRRMRFNWIE